MNKVSSLEYNYLKQIILRLKKKEWEFKDIEYLYDKFKCFIKDTGLDELSILRYGEFIAGPTLNNLNYSDYNNIRYNISELLDKIEELNIPVIVVISGTILNLTINNNRK